MIQLRRTTTYASRRDGASDATSNRHYRPRYRRFRRKRRGALPAIFSVTRAVWVIASSTSGFGPLRQFAAARQYVGYRGIAGFASRPPGRFMGSRPKASTPNPQNYFSNEAKIAARGPIRGHFGPDPLASLPTCACREEKASVVECREQFQRVGLCLVVIDEKLGLVCCHHPPDSGHGGYRRGLVGIEGRHDVPLKIIFGVNNVTGQDDEARIFQMDQQGLMSGRVTWCGNQRDAAPIINTSVSPSSNFSCFGVPISLPREPSIDSRCRSVHPGPKSSVYSTRCIRTVEFGNKTTLPMWSPCVWDIAT